MKKASRAGGLAFNTSPYARDQSSIPIPAPANIAQRHPVRVNARPTPKTSRLPNNPWRDGSDLSDGDPHTSGDCSTRPNRTVAHVGEDAETDAVLIPCPSGLEQLTRASIGMGSIATCSSMRAESGGA